MDQAIVAAYQETARGLPSDSLFYDKELNAEFVSICKHKGIDGSPYVWNQRLLELQKDGKLPPATQEPPKLSNKEVFRYAFAAEVAWCLMAIDYHKTLDQIFSSPDAANEFDRLAQLYGPEGVTSLEYRRAALSLRKVTKSARGQAQKKYESWMQGKDKSSKLRSTPLAKWDNRLFKEVGIYFLMSNARPLVGGLTEDLREHAKFFLHSPAWQGLEPSEIAFLPAEGSVADRYAKLSAFVHRLRPLLNCRLWTASNELAQ